MRSWAVLNHVMRFCSIVCHTGFPGKYNVDNNLIRRRRLAPALRMYSRGIAGEVRHGDEAEVRSS